MANMSYIRFESTLKGLRDCYDSMSDDLSGSEKVARERLLLLCARITEDYADEIGVLEEDRRLSKFKRSTP
jgi:hypothetical protein